MPSRYSIGCMELKTSRPCVKNMQLEVSRPQLLRQRHHHLNRAGLAGLKVADFLVEDPFHAVRHVQLQDEVGLLEKVARGERGAEMELVVDITASSFAACSQERC